MLSYAGVYLTAPTPDLVGWCMSHIPYEWLPDFAERSWPGKTQTALAFRGLLPRGPVRVGTLAWPQGACRWGRAYYLATDAQVSAIRTVIASSGGNLVQPLVIDDGQRTVTVTMQMLPPRPLSQIGGANGLNLLALTCPRYAWWFRSATVSLTPGTTTWATLFASVASALGIALTVDAIPAAYLEPSGDLAGNYDALPPLLDACCLSTGLRLVAGLDGSYRAMSATAAQTILASNLSSLKPKIAGGTFALAP